jgi:epsilon-lactone hydrolase
MVDQPSLSARIFGVILRATKVVSRRYQGGPNMLKLIAAVRRAPPIEPSRHMRAAVAIHREEFGGRPVWHFAPRDSAPVARMLYFHGGGYVFPPVIQHWQLLTDLAQNHGIESVAPLYPLAPDATASDTTAFALSAYRRFCDVGGRMVIGGDSAGGGLAAATLMAARDTGLALPDAALLICPWLDASGSHPDQPAIEPRDSILRISGIRDAGRLYAGDLPVDDWRVSPIGGDWSGLPPMLVYGGADDILVTDARALKARLPTIDYVEGAGSMHDWPLFFFPESRAARAAMGRFVAG